MGRDTAVNCPCARVLALWILMSNYILGRVGVGEGREADALFKLLLRLLRGHVLRFQGKLTAQGKLLGQDTFLVTEPEAGGLLSSRGRERRVFLFEQIVIFSEALGGGGRGGVQPGYVYKNSIKVGRGIWREPARWGGAYGGADPMEQGIRREPAPAG